MFTALRPGEVTRIGASSALVERMYDAANRHDGHALLAALRDANRALSGEDPWSAVTAVTS